MKRPDLAARNRARKLPWPPSCARCGAQRRPRPEGGYQGANGLCGRCDIAERRARHA